MMKKWGQYIVIILTLFGVGEVMRFPQESLTKELKKEGFIPERLSHDKQLKIGQTGSAVVLGGLRSLVASFMNLQAFGEFEEQDWSELERLYEIIVTLQPRNAYYWETAGWHLAYNAYYDFESKPGMAAARRKLKQKEYHKKGENMLLRGTEELPNSVPLWIQLAKMHSSPHKPYDFPKAAKYYKKAIEIPDSRYVVSGPVLQGS